MKTKQPYKTPEISIVMLDCEISLQLNSDPNPLGDPEWTTQSGINQNPWMIFADEGTVKFSDIKIYKQ